MQQNNQPEYEPRTQYDGEIIREALLAKKKELGMSNAVISDISGVPESTLAKYFNGSTPNPSFETVIGVARALDVSVDALYGITPVHDTPETKDKPDNMMNRCTSLLVQSNQRLFALYDRELRKKDRINMFLGGILLALVIADMLIGSRGWILYDTVNRARDIASGFVSGLFTI